MPQVDLETLVSACAGVTCDRKIACETLSATTSTNNNHSQPPPPPADSPDVAEVPPDFPPESFWLSKDAELDWFSTNAYYERKDSTKGNSNSANLNPNLIPNPNHNSSNSQRFSSLHAKASIIGLPKTQKSTYVVDTKKRRNCNHGNTRLFFPKRSGSTGKSDSTGMIEPSSPKVSCMGRVRSKKDRHSLRKKQQQEQLSSKSIGKKESSRKDKKKKRGFFASLKTIFRCKSNIKDISQRTGNDTSYGGSVSESYTFKKSSDIMDRLPASDRDAPHRRSFGMEPVAAEPVGGLGGMTRFASGRRSESWSAEIGVA